MPMWHDPLDELIADLEQSVPAVPAPTFDIPPMEDHCLFMEATLTRDPAKRSRLAEDPRVQRVRTYYDQLARARQSSGPVEPTG